MATLQDDPTAAGERAGAFLRRYADWILGLGVLGLVLTLVAPVPPVLLDLLLAVNITASLLLLLLTMNTRAAVELSAFPTLLLFATLFRLGLNVASTRLILSGGRAGTIIEAFGTYVTGDSLAVGLVVFLVLIVIQFVVITKGAGRISEVAARFVLDAMPGKQMAIDADLNAGLISEKDARERRAKIATEAEFYGAMDGASKFVKGDAIAGLIITLINITAGFIIGMTMLNMSAEQSLQTFAMLTIGDGLVSQIPSLLITIGSGLLVTKVRSDETMAQELAREFFLKPKAFAIASAIVLLMGFVPGMPLLPFAVLSGILFLLYHALAGVDPKPAETAAKQRAVEEAKKPVEEKVEDLIASDRLGVEIGYRLIPLVDKERGGTLLDRITSLRKQLARDGGVLIPPIRIKDNIQLPPTSYRLMLYGQTIASGELQPDRLLAIDGGGVTAALQGVATKEPAFGLDAYWIEASRRAEAEGAGYTVTDPASVFITHLTQVLKSHAAAILNREDVQAMLTSLKKDSPALVKDIETNAKLGTVQKVLGILLEEKVPISNLEKILEGIADNPAGDPAQIAEQVRSRIGRSVVAPYLGTQGKLMAVILEPATEQRLSQAMVNAQHGGGLGIAPA
jgi:flagellar biosynthesis protein FlhA